MHHSANRVPAALADAGGALLATTLSVMAAVRRAAKPLHPAGAVVLGRLERTRTQPVTGIPWLDDPGVDEVLVRRSRAVGLPETLPDIHGLAVRVPIGSGHADLLFASTGRGAVTRFLLTVSRSPEGRPLTTLLPYRSPAGPLLLAATAAGPDRFTLSCAAGTGGWHDFGTLVLSDSPGGDELVSFDPVLNTIPGLDNYEWVRRLREPSYSMARGSRR